MLLAATGLYADLIKEKSICETNCFDLLGNGCFRYRPYIFTDAELSTLFTTFDTLPPRYNSPSREYIVPVFFRLMYCCGMRPGEPRRLKCDDVNLDNGDIYIRKTKRNKDRHIVMSEDVRKLCVQYDRMMGERQWFSQRWNGDPLENQWVRSQFSICWNRSGLEKRQNPRPYDLRHCFATRTMMRWIDEGRDIMAMLPYLSAYMGHAKFSYTLYYVHLLPDRLLNRKSTWLLGERQTYTLTGGSCKIERA